jgi:hypothetical protein
VILTLNETFVSGSGLVEGKSHLKSLVAPAAKGTVETPLSPG